tara:strand:- start:26982 stop:27809 length:828 start_codon:yes stop_codon:yes gene_type:complete
MGYSKPTQTTKTYLENAELPEHNESYAVIPHIDVIENTTNMLNAAGFTITEEIYRANANANVAQGIYHIKPTNSHDIDVINETEIGMMFGWTNSYDKSTRFQCAIGGYVMVCSNGMVAGDMMSYSRKHTGSAAQEIKMQIANQIKNAEKHYKVILKDRDALKIVSLDIKKQSELLGRLYIEKKIINSTQINIIKREMEEPSYNYNVDKTSAWHFYNNVTHALKETHPRDWMRKTQTFHDFIIADLKGQMGIKYNDTVDPNQSDLFSMVEILENDN